MKCLLILILKAEWPKLQIFPFRLHCNPYQNSRRNNGQLWKFGGSKIKSGRVHEEYIECLDVLARFEEIDRANDSYKEQRAQKPAFEIAIESWKSRAMSNNRRDDDVKSFTRKLSKSSQGGSSGSSSASVVLARRKEQLALAQLKTKQFLREQRLQCKMSEIQYERDLMEAEMEEEQALASVNVFKEIFREFLKTSAGIISTRNVWQR